METLWDVKPSLRRQLADGLAQAAAALTRDGAAFLAPAFPGMVAADDCRLLQVPPLEERHSEESEVVTVARWPEEGLLATRWPVLIFVLDGECDVRFGVTPEVRRHVPALPPEIGQYVVTAHKNQFLLIPSHFPRPDGGGIHWERPGTGNAASTLMWFIFFPTGCFVHFCKTQGEEHSQTKSVYLSVARTFRLIEDVESEALDGKAQWQVAVRNYLEVLVLLLQRQANTAQFEMGTSRTITQAGRDAVLPHRPSHFALQRACLFIEDHLEATLSVPHIAAAAGVSASGLNQLFRRYMETSVAQYIISRRLERASTLLCETNLAVKLVAAQCGFPSLEHFSRTFRRATGVAPLAYRRRFQKLDE